MTNRLNDSLLTTLLCFAFGNACTAHLGHEEAHRSQTSDSNASEAAYGERGPTSDNAARAFDPTAQLPGNTQLPGTAFNTSEPETVLVDFGSRDPAPSDGDATGTSVVPSANGTTEQFSLGDIEVLGDPIRFDAFEGYGEEELNLLRAHDTWPAMQRAKTVSFSYPGQIALDLPEGPVTRDSIVGRELPSNVARAVYAFDESDWDYITPVRDVRYTYRDFLQAVAKWPRFCAEMNAGSPYLDGVSLDDVCALEIATVFAHFAQEVGAHSDDGGPAPAPPGSDLATPGAAMPNEQWRQGLFYIEELGYAGTDNVGYRQCEGNWGLAFPCDAQASYHGRGAKQLSYNYNYGPFSRVVFGSENMETLLNAPERVAAEGWLALSSAFYFYMTPRSPKPSIHETVTGLWLPSELDKQAERLVGFGVTIQIINGGLECNSPLEAATAKNRREYFTGLASYMNIWDSFVSAQPKHDCINMSSFTSGNGYEYPPSWVELWDGSIGLATWEEGPFSPLFPADYYRAAQAASVSSHWDWNAGKGASP